MPGYLEELLKKYGIGPTGQPMGPTPGETLPLSESTLADFDSYMAGPSRGQAPEPDLSKAGMGYSTMSGVAPRKVYPKPSLAVQALMKDGKIQAGQLDASRNITPNDPMEGGFIPPESGNIDYEDKPEFDTSGIEQTSRDVAGAQETGTKDRERRRLQGLADIAEGLGSIGRGGPYTAGGVMFDKGNREPFVAEGIRAEMDRNEDKLSDSERSMYGQLMSSVSGQRVDVPKDMTRSRLETFMKPYMNGMTSFSPASILRAQSAAKNAETNALKGDEYVTRGEFDRETKYPFQSKMSKDKFITGIIQKETAGYESLKKQIQSTMQYVRNARGVLKSGSETGIKALPVMLVKAAGDVGNIAIAEQQAYSGRVAYFSRLKDKLAMAAMGEITPEWKADIEKLLDVYEEQAAALEETVKKRASTRTSNFLGRSGIQISPEEIDQYYISAEDTLPSQSQDGVPATKEGLPTGGAIGGGMIKVRAGGRPGEIPESQWEAFKAENPDAVKE